MSSRLAVILFVDEKVDCPVGRACPLEVSGDLLSSPSLR